MVAASGAVKRALFWLGDTTLSGRVPARHATADLSIVHVTLLQKCITVVYNSKRLHVKIHASSQIMS